LEQTERSAAGLPVLLSQEHYAPGVFSLTVQRLRRDRTTLTGRRTHEPLATSELLTPPTIDDESEQRRDR